MAEGVEITEACRCGSSTTVKGLPRQDAAAAVTRWREAHRCLGPDEQPKVPYRTGAGTILGFQPGPWDFDRGPMIR